MFKKIGLLKLGGCVLALGFLNALINPEDEKEVKKEVQVVEEVKNEIDYNALNVEDIKSIIIQIVGDKTKQDKERILTLEVSDKNYIFIELNADNSHHGYDNLDLSSEIFNELKKFNKAEMITINWYDDAVDIYGAEKEVIVTAVGLTKQTLNKIEFENFFFDDYKNVADNYYMHPNWTIDFKY
mgnify:FL=1